MKTLQIVATAVLLAGVARAKEATTEIKVSGMTCSKCAVSVQKSLERTKGVKHAEVRVEKGLAIVMYDDARVNEQQLREAIHRTRFKAEPSEGKK